jgi:orotidine-5'-phosphate decarboxylase
MKENNLKNKICLALDVDSYNNAKNFVKQLKEFIGMFKIGSQLFTKEGPKIVEGVRNLGGDVFLDLKFHDIPNTVANASRMATRLGVKMFNIHASGGSEMMRAAVEAAAEESQKCNLPIPVILAVTVLTSVDDTILSKEMRVPYKVKDQVVHLAKLAQSSRVQGVVASPNEVSAIRESCGTEFVILTPGIRPTWSAGKDDQKRITTPRDAINLGADYIVIGRPILKADDPIEAAIKVLDELS